MMSWFFLVAQGFEHHELRQATQISSTRSSMSVKSRQEPVSLPEGQSASRPERLETPPCPDCFSQAAGVTFQQPREGRRAFLSVGVLPPSLLSSFVFPCWFPGELSRSRGCAVATSPIRGLAGVVVPHLRVAVRFLPTREGSGTKSTGRRPKNRASFRYPPQYVVRSRILPYFYTLGLRFLAQPAVTSASEVLTQTYRSPVRVLCFP